MAINPDSFIIEGRTEVLPRGRTIEHGTVEVTLQRETRRVPATRSSEGTIYVTKGIGGRQPGGRAMSAMITRFTDGKVRAYYGRTEASSLHNFFFTEED